MNNRIRKIGMIFVLVGCIPVLASASDGQRFSARPSVVGTPCTTSVSQKEIGFLLDSVSPELRRKMADPAFRNEQFASFRELFAMACQAVKEGLHDEPENAEALKFMEIGVTAAEYDRMISKTSGAAPYKWITTEQIKEFYADRQNVTDFENFRALGRQKNPDATQDGTDARREFAVMMIAYREFLNSEKELPAEFAERTDFTIRLQQSQFLARQYSERVLTPKIKATDAEIDASIAALPQYSKASKRDRAEKILKRALAGEDFAALAKQFSEDPGSKDMGGLYEGIRKKQMLPEFENAALALQPGQISRNLVETDFGYHIIKLEKLRETKDSAGQVTQIYDVRHIQILTTIKDPDAPDGRETPVREFVRNKLEGEREKKAIDEIVKANPVTIAGEAPSAPRKAAPGKE